MPRTRRPATAAGVLVVAGALLAGLGCAGLAGHTWRLDEDSEVLPLREPTAPAAEGPAPAPPAAEEPRLRSVVILLPDANGEVGIIEVVKPGGAATLSRAREAVWLDDLDRTFIADDEQIRDAHRSALDAEPEAPEGFTVHFRSGGTALDEASEARWDEIVSRLAARSVPEVTVAGHTDRVGDEEHNLELSKQRALAIRDALVGAGLDADLIEIAWYGETAPAASTEDGAPERLNRRAEIRVR